MLVVSSGPLGDVWATGRLLLAGAVVEPPMPAGWVELDRSEAGFRVAYPQDWHVSGVDALWGATTLSNYDTMTVPDSLTPSDERSFKLDIAVQPNPKNLPVEAWVNQTEALAAASPIHNAAAPRTAKSATLHLGGKEAVNREYENGVHAYYISGDARIYVVSFLKQADFVETAESIIHSIRVAR